MHVFIYLKATSKFDMQLLSNRHLGPCGNVSHRIEEGDWQDIFFDPIVEELWFLLG